jgi:hypothetical protein
LIYSSKTGRSPFLRVFACQTTTTTTINSISASSLHFNPTLVATLLARVCVCVSCLYFFSLLLFRDEHRERAVGDVEVDPGAVDVRRERPAALPLAARAAAAHGQPPPRIVEHNGQGRGVARLAVYYYYYYYLLLLLLLVILWLRYGYQ